MAPQSVALQKRLCLLQCEHKQYKHSENGHNTEKNFAKNLHEGLCVKILLQNHHYKKEITEKPWNYTQGVDALRAHPQNGGDTAGWWGQNSQTTNIQFLVCGGCVCVMAQGGRWKIPAGYCRISFLFLVQYIKPNILVFQLSVSFYKELEKAPPYQHLRSSNSDKDRDKVWKIPRKRHSQKMIQPNWNMLSIQQLPEHKCPTLNLKQFYLILLFSNKMNFELRKQTNTLQMECDFHRTSE